MRLGPIGAGGLARPPYRGVAVREPEVRLAYERDVREPGGALELADGEPRAHGPLTGERVDDLAAEGAQLLEERRRHVRPDVREDAPGAVTLQAARGTCREGGHSGRDLQPLARPLGIPEQRGQLALAGREPGLVRHQRGNLGLGLGRQPDLGMGPPGRQQEGACEKEDAAVVRRAREHWNDYTA